MSAHVERGSLVPLRRDLDALRGHWAWFLALGIGLIVLGVVATGSVVLTTLATATAFGVVMFVAGFGEALGAFWSRDWSGYFHNLLGGIFALIAGLFCITTPVDGALAMTLVLAGLLMFLGLFRVIGSITLMYPYWGLAALGGLVDVLLGVLIWVGWPSTGLWVIGLYLGLHLIYYGAFWTVLALRVRKLPRYM